LLARLAWLCPLVWTACVRDDPHHCANQNGDGDAYCAAKYDGGFCSKCTAKYDGCVEIQADISGECRPDNVTTAADDDATSDPSATSTPTDPTTDDSASETTSPTTSEPTTVGDSSTGDVPELPRCGNDVIDTVDENCDGTDQPATMCHEIGLQGGAVACYPAGSPNECTYDLTGCANTEVCDNMVVEGNEQCEDGVEFDETCQSISPLYIGGELTCTECKYNTTNCTPCVPNGEDCTSLAQCCAATACLGVCLL